MTSNVAYEIVPISAEDADRLRERGGEVYVADEQPHFPCRRCLRHAASGEELILVSHDPFGSGSPYRSPSPIFLHRGSCEPSEPGGELPAQLTRRQLAVRSFDADEMMIDAAVIAGDDLDATIRHLFEADSADHLHIYNAARGCWAASVARR